MIMREILFRGKTSKGVFTYGLPTHEMEYIFGGDDLDSPDAYLVDPSTIGQHIGLKDKDGTKIFEGDILRIAITDSDDNTEYEFGSVEFSTEGLGYIIRSKEGLVCGFGTILNSAGFYTFELEVIGNIYENKELLK